jgi:D-alanyl-lipoteichoic acid acyltransferase DltB (MBOAT superfamily)
VDYFLALKIAHTSDLVKRRVYLIISLVMNFGFLGFFKYFNFFIDSFHHVAALFGSGDRLHFYLRVILPAGISFYTFQAVAYIVDVYFKKLKPAENLVDYALFISFFPHLVAGPIQRPSHLLPQVQNSRRYDPRQFFDGLMLILTGLFRKCVIADNCALLANAAFSGQLGKPDLFVLLLGAYAFAWQIYGDFSGYSDIARGSAQLLGFHFVVNFRQPYFAVGFSDFWRRWHISLSTWLRDYLYIPLGGNRRGERRTYGNLFTTMLLGGLWHGANWTFVFWGGLHGAALAVERRLGFKSDGQPGSTGAAAGSTPWRVWGKRLLIFHLVCLLWILFRAPSLEGAWQMLRGAAHLSWSPIYLTSFKFLIIFSLPLFLLDLRLEKHGEEYPFQRGWQVSARRSYAFKAAFGALLLGLTLLMAATESNAFIYFQF